MGIYKRKIFREKVKTRFRPRQKNQEKKHVFDKKVRFKKKKRKHDLDHAIDQEKGTF